MNINFNKRTIQQLMQEPGHTFLERRLMELCLRLHNRIFKVETDLNNYRMTVYSICSTLQNRTPWAYDQMKSMKEKDAANATAIVESPDPSEMEEENA